MTSPVYQKKEQIKSPSLRRLCNCHKIVELLLFKRLLFKEYGNHTFHHITLIFEKFFGAEFCVFNELTHFTINMFSRLFTVITTLMYLLAKKNNLIILAKRARTQEFTHAVLRHHLARQLRCLPQIA